MTDHTADKPFYVCTVAVTLLFSAALSLLAVPYSISAAGAAGIDPLWGGTGHLALAAVLAGAAFAVPAWLHLGASAAAAHHIALLAGAVPAAMLATLVHPFAASLLGG
jgi:hypothetical protein